jgi:hypothetical protein
MKMTEVESSNIKALGFEDGIMEVEFVKGGKYRYKNVPAEVFRAVRGAASVGRAFHRLIRPKQHIYEYEKI